MSMNALGIELYSLFDRAVPHEFNTDNKKEK